MSEENDEFSTPLEDRPIPRMSALIEKISTLPKLTRDQIIQICVTGLLILATFGITGIAEIILDGCYAIIIYISYPTAKNTLKKLTSKKQTGKSDE